MTKEEYARKVAARFGGFLPPFKELAFRENIARLKAIGKSPLDVSNPTGINAAPASRTAALRQAFNDRRAARDLEMLDYLTADFRTSGDVATRFKISLETAQSSLRKLKEQGLIVTARTRRTTIYRKAGLEPEPQQTAKGVSTPPVAITVRGQAFPSLRSCARHFGISVQAVHDAVRRGCPDGIGMRKMEAAE